MIKLAAPMRSGVNRLAHIPWMFDGMRWLLEGGFRSHRRLLARHFRNSPARVLDCGCGTGIFANCFPPSAYVGVDLSENYIARARSLYPGYDFRVMDATRLELPDGSFDAVIVSGLLHHLDDDDAHSVLSELRRVLNARGTLLVWEDVPTRSRFNAVGHMVHRLDVGEHIRAESGYRDLLGPYFSLADSEALLSGCMDYVVFKLTPRE